MKKKAEVKLSERRAGQRLQSFTAQTFEDKRRKKARRKVRLDVGW